LPFKPGAVAIGWLHGSTHVMSAHWGCLAVSCYLFQGQRQLWWLRQAQAQVVCMDVLCGFGAFCCAQWRIFLDMALGQQVETQVCPFLTPART
jgi:hypothetical protein